MYLNKINPQQLFDIIYIYSDKTYIEIKEIFCSPNFNNKHYIKRLDKDEYYQSQGVRIEASDTVNVEMCAWE